MTQGRTRVGHILITVLVLSLSMGNPAVFADDAKVKPLPPGVAACDINALANDQTPGGLNVRSEPNSNSAILGHLRVIENIYKEKIAADLHVIGVKNGWFLIESAGYGDYDLPKKLPPVYSGRGWVSGKLLTTGLRALTLKAAPHDDAADVAQLHSDENADNAFGPDSVNVTAILDCKGEWFLIEAPLATQNYSINPNMPSDGPKGTVRGWTVGSCTNQRTTCV